MKKDKLINVIKKYHLNNTIDSVKWTIGNDKAIDINFVTSDRTLVGSLRATGFDIEESELGIYTTAQLLKLLSVFGDDIDFSMLKIDNVARTMNMKDKESSVTYMLSDLSVIPIAGKPKALPEFQMQIKADADFISKFNKSKNALPDISHVTFNCKGDKKEMIIGYSSNNTTRITVPINASCSGDVEYKSFNSNYLKEILVANSDATSISLEVSNAGLMIVTASNSDYSATYYLVEISHI
jgi:hypothetical protein